MVDQQRLQAALNEFAHTLVSQYEIGQVLHRLSDHVTEVVDAAGCGVSILDADDDLRFVSATSAPVERVERYQEEAGHGPCAEAAAHGTVVAVADLVQRGARWAEFTPAAVDAGVRSVLAVPMRATEQTMGALNVYRFEVHQWDRAEVEAATTLTAMATAYVLLAGRIESSQQRAQQLQRALDSRVVVEQAKGMLAAQHDESPDQAYTRLRQHARDHNLAVRQVARDVIDERLDL